MEHPATEPTAPGQTEDLKIKQNPAPTMPQSVPVSVPETVTESVRETAQPPPSAAQTTTPPKPIHSLVIDANAIIKNDPTVSTLLAQAEELYTIPAVVSESMAAFRFVGVVS